MIDKASTPSRPASIGGAPRIGVIGPTGNDDFAENIVDCLPDLGVHAVPLGPAIPAPRNRALGRAVHAVRAATQQPDLVYQRRLVARAERESLDLVVSTDSRLLPTTVRALRRSGTRVCLWFPDPVDNLGRQYMLMGDYDALFFKDPLLARRLADVVNLPAWYLPEACNPARHRPPATAGQDPYVVFVGNTYGTRLRLIHKLLEHGIKVRMFGPPVPRWLRDPLLMGLHAGRYVTGEDKARVFRGALAVINALKPAEMESVNCRLFEATACGGTVLCERRTALADLFTEDKEILGFTDFDELVAHLRACAADRPAARALGDAASLRSHSEHTYQQRLAMLLGVML
ncbi:CgeB family protein [Candidatus Frankia alpina]|uniref:CgeB family protein n=1 Tax=Candidatus Frankia alpina TaxID=2699483 RepID=UPI0013D6204E|nr:glycosyltransferase [Candidatus Frankia alpina]